MPELDTAKTEAFAGQMMGMLNNATLALLTSVGHRTGLFDTLAGLPASTSIEVARAAGLNERYVREWLGGMVVGRIVEYDAASERYSLPPEHASYLTRAAGPDNMAMLMQYVGLMGQVEGRVVDCFRNGGGVPYSAYPNFQELQAEESRQTHDIGLLDSVVPLVPGLHQRLESGISVLDVGCGQGHAMNVLARAFSRSRCLGYDFSPEGVAAGNAEAAAWGLTNARFEVQDVAALQDREAFDLVTAFDSIHDQARPRDVLEGIARALKPGGVFLMVDIAASTRLEENLDHPLAPALYTFSTMHCMTVSLAQGGEGLGTVWGEQKARELLAGAGFTDVRVERTPKDILNSYYIATRG